MADTKAFEITYTAPDKYIMTHQGIQLSAQIPLKEARDNLEDYDVLIVPGAPNVTKIVKSGGLPIPLIKAFADLQTANPARERTLLAIDTAALYLANQGLLQGLGATTHADYYIKLEHACQEAAANDTQERTDVMEERYVVNNARFDIGEDLEENPYVYSKSRTKSNARKGSLARKESNAKPENLTRRKSMKLGGLRVITSGGAVSGLDASLYLVSALVSHDCAQEVARLLAYDWVKGVVVDTIDV